jgi:hypothetical protein
MVLATNNVNNDSNQSNVYHNPVTWIRIVFTVDPVPAVNVHADRDLQKFDNQKFYNFYSRKKHSFVKKLQYFDPLASIKASKLQENPPSQKRTSSI